VCSARKVERYSDLDISKFSDVSEPQPFSKSEVSKAVEMRSVEGKSMRMRSPNVFLLLSDYFYLLA
ncbi:MAG: hypothetical protein KAH00_06530, partial [Cocleimonas sp.]|nr:hypothetical protein [Cocleimonas sp.]